MINTEYCKGPFFYALVKVNPPNVSKIVNSVKMSALLPSLVEVSAFCNFVWQSAISQLLGKFSQIR